MSRNGAIMAAWFVVTLFTRYMRRLPRQATEMRHSIAAFHSSASCLSLGSLVMYSAASRNVMSLRPLGRPPFMLVASSKAPSLLIWLSCCQLN
jgi:hypothetical protein